MLAVDRSRSTMIERSNTPSASEWEIAAGRSAPATYNRQRRHSTIHYLAPLEFEAMRFAS
jgi:hypothetical protein